MFFLAALQLLLTSSTCASALRYSGWFGPKCDFTSANFCCSSSRRSDSFFRASPWVETWAASMVPVSHRIVGRFLAHPVGLGVGVFGVQLQQARREDAGLLLRVDDVEFALELGQRRAGPLHLRLQFLQLLFHEGGEVGGRLVANVIRVFQVGARDGIGRVSGQSGDRPSDN